MVWNRQRALENSFCYRIPAEQLLYEEKRNVVRVDWLYGLTMTRKTGTVFTNLTNGPKATSIRNKDRSVEDISCISRLVGFFEHNGRRYILDQEQRKLQTKEARRLCGVVKVT